MTGNSLRQAIGLPARWIQFCGPGEMTALAPTISVQDGYVLVERPTGFRVALADELENLPKIADACRSSGTNNVLVKGESSNVQLSAIDIFQVGQLIAELDLRVAVVESHNASKEDVRFLENVTANRGAPLQFFDRESDAIGWLGDQG